MAVGERVGEDGGDSEEGAGKESHMTKGEREEGKKRGSDGEEEEGGESGAPREEYR